MAPRAGSQWRRIRPLCVAEGAIGEARSIGCSLLELNDHAKKMIMGVMIVTIDGDNGK